MTLVPASRDTILVMRRNHDDFGDRLCSLCIRDAILVMIKEEPRWVGVRLRSTGIAY